VDARRHGNGFARRRRPGHGYRRETTGTESASTLSWKPSPGEFSISDLAREFDVTPRAIRFYEDQGLLAPRRDGQRRIYTPRDRTRLKLTLRGKRLGLSLSEIRELIDMYEPGRDERPQLERFLGVLETHKASLLQQRADLEAQLSELQAFERRVRKQLKRG
jgi:DNA-binding transcriptional MerR regulator